MAVAHVYFVPDICSQLRNPEFHSGLILSPSMWVMWLPCTEQGLTCVLFTFASAGTNRPVSFTRGYAPRNNTRNGSITHSLQRRLSTKSSHLRSHGGSPWFDLPTTVLHHAALVRYPLERYPCLVRRYSRVMTCSSIR